MKPSPTVLIIDPERPTRRLLRALLESQQYKIFEAESGQSGINQAAVNSPDVIILELALTDVEGLSVIQRLREWNQAPIIVLSDRTDDSDKVRALDIGANDYITKPFSSSELLARLRVQQRPIPWEADGPVFINDSLKVDLSTRVVTVNGRAIDLTPTEQAIFYVLVRHAGQIVTRRHLFRCVWGMDCESKRHDLHVYIASLRQKLRDSADQVFISTEGSQGYSLVAPRKSAQD